MGICPLALVLKAGHLSSGTCADSGFTVANGTTTKQAGPCGKITFDDYVKPAQESTDVDIPLVTFDGNPLTNFAWKTVDDPVMGGQSHSTWSATASDGFGTWVGHVAIVPFLKAPGFCTIRTTKSSNNQFPNVSGTNTFKMMARNNVTSQLKTFTLQVETKGGVVNGRQGTYSGNVTVPNTGQWVEVEANWSDFVFQWRGQSVAGPSITTQLNQIIQLGVSTSFPGKVGSFDLEIKSLSAGN